MRTRTPHGETPDGRYIIVRGRLWRKSNPNLTSEERDRLVKELMSARRAVREAAGSRNAVHAARRRVDDAKLALGERGPVWWTDGAPDYNRHMIENTPYLQSIKRGPCNREAEEQLLVTSQQD